jgi:hypothetical protein
MNHRLLVIVLLGCILPSLRATESTPGMNSLAALHWLAGTWLSDTNGRQIREQWMPPAGGTMLGMSRTVVQGRTVEHEFLLLRQESSGEIQYVAKPARQAEASFKLTRVSATEAVFENPQHDFPQRIRYQLKPDGVLVAAIEGEKNGRSRRVEFVYRRSRD